MKNLISVTLTLNEAGLKKFNRIPTFKNLLHPSQLTKLKTGENTLNVNHTTWGRIQRITGYDRENMQVQKTNQ